MEHRPGRVPRSLVLIAAALVGCAGPGATSSPSFPPPAEVSPTPAVTPRSTPTPSPSPSPMPTWAVVSEWPEADAPGTLLLMHVSWGDEGGHQPLLVVLADGRVVVKQWTPSDQGVLLMKRRLTPAGIEQVRTRLTEVGLFDRDRKRQMIRSWPAGGAGDQLRVRLGTTTVAVSRNLAPPEYYAPSAAWDRFDALVEALRAPEGWLPADAWADVTWSPYHASVFCLRLEQFGYGPDTGLDAADLDTSGDMLPFAAFGTPGINEGTRFGPVDASAAYRLAASIAELANAKGIPSNGWEQTPLDQGGGRFGFGTVFDGGLKWLVLLDALMPAWACADQ